MRTIMSKRLPHMYYTLLEQAGWLAENLGFKVYAVGGFVRDILLNRPNRDLDLVVEGDGILFARVLAHKLSGQLRVHRKFKTAVVFFNDSTTGHLKRVDVATARLEYYEYPAALPIVEPSSIKIDLYRRDFTINALAMHLNPGQLGRIVDFFDAQRDIKDHRIRVLHPLSFEEDPTRILRAVRFEQRFGFYINQQTERLIKNTLQLDPIQKLSGTRVLRELKFVLEEKKPLACLHRLQQLHVLESIHPALSFTPIQKVMLNKVERTLHWYRLLSLEPPLRTWLVYLLGLTRGTSGNELSRIASLFHLSFKSRYEFLGIHATIDTLEDKLSWWIRSNASHAELYEMLQPIAVEGVLLLMAQTKNEAVRKAIYHYLTQLKDLRNEITGDDLLKLGVPPGPMVGKLLRHIFTVRLNGLAPTLSVQQSVAQKLVHELDLEDTLHLVRCRLRPEKFGLTVYPGKYQCSP
ncbi:hypothetical protein DSUL_80059 [Desulfovibrionales bacterium]